MVKLRSVRRPRVDVSLKYNSHGVGKKNLIVLHETVSKDQAGLGDVKAVGHYLDTVDYGIHCIVDAEGNSGAVPPRNEVDVYYHAQSGNGLVNTRGIGIEQISWPNTNPIYYWRRLKQLHKVARWCAYYSKVHEIPTIYTPGCNVGITTHNDVSRTYHVPGGHSDCKPPYPVKFVVRLAAAYRKTGWL